MMDKETGRPRGFGFVTFDSEAAVDRTLEQPLAICNKPIEVKRAQPRGDMRDEGARGGKFGRHGKQDNFNQGFGNQQGGPMPPDGQQGGMNMTPAAMAAYWQRMQQYFTMMQQQMAMSQNPQAQMGMMNPQMMQQMMAQRGMQMNPQMMQQMAAMQGGGGQGGFPGMGSSNNGSQSPMNGGGSPGANRSGFNAQEQLMFEQRKYEQQQMQRMGPGGGNFNGPQGTWEGMYDDVPAPAAMQGPRGGFGGGRGRGGRQGGTPQPSGQAPANAPTGPKNAGRPGGNYRGGGRGGHRGYHPYARGPG